MCHSDTGSISAWFIILKNGNELGSNPLILKVNPRFPGIAIQFTTNNFTTLLISVNTSDTSVTGIKCESTDAANNKFYIQINFTIYGEQFL